jgi:hypothetical protein
VNVGAPPGTYPHKKGIVIMRGASDMGGPALGRAGAVRDEPGEMPSGELEDSWFHWPRVGSRPPAAHASDAPESIDDEVADAWFR